MSSKNSLERMDAMWEHVRSMQETNSAERQQTSKPQPTATPASAPDIWNDGLPDLGPIPDLTKQEEEDLARSLANALQSIDTDCRNLPTPKPEEAPTGTFSRREHARSYVYSCRVNSGKAKLLDDWIDREIERTGQNRNKIIAAALLAAALAQI